MKSPEVARLAGRVLYGLGRIDEALEQIRAGAEPGFSMMETHYYLGLCHLAQGNRLLCLEEFERLAAKVWWAVPLRYREYLAWRRSELSASAPGRNSNMTLRKIRSPRRSSSSSFSFSRTVVVSDAGWFRISAISASKSFRIASAYFLKCTAFAWRSACSLRACSSTGVDRFESVLLRETVHAVGFFDEECVQPRQGGRPLRGRGGVRFRHARRRFGGQVRDGSAGGTNP